MPPSLTSLPAVRRRVLCRGGGQSAGADRAVPGRPGRDQHVPRSRLPLTERLERAFTDRLATLPGPARALLRMAAVDDSAALGEIMTAARVWTGAEIGPADIDTAVSAMLVDVAGAEVRFCHPLMRSAIHQSMTAADRRAAHAALAQVLPPGQEDRRIRHRAAATALPDESVAAELAAAADRAARRGGVSAAVDALTAGRRAERGSRGTDRAPAARGRLRRRTGAAGHDGPPAGRRGRERPVRATAGEGGVAARQLRRGTAPASRRTRRR